MRGHGFFFGIDLASSNLASNITVTQSFVGFIIEHGGSNNILKGNIANGNTCGFSSNGNGNVWRGNDSRITETGFAVSGTGNDVRGNTASPNSQDGIQVPAGSTENTIRGNTALGNNTSGGTFYDLEDDNANCDFKHLAGQRLCYFESIMQPVGDRASQVCLSQFCPELHIK